jgi:glycosyltransferase involved in cell wall biosynthesis
VKRAALIAIRGMSNAGGVERVVSQQVRFLRDLGYEARVVMLPERGWLARLRARSTIVERVMLVTFPLVSWVAGRSWAGRDGIVISHGYSSVGIACDAVFAHGCWAAYARAAGVRRGLFSFLVGAYERSAGRWARLVISVSEEVGRQWREHYSVRKDKGRVIRNGVDVRLFAPDGSIDRVCLGPSTRVIFVGRLEPGKGLAYLRALHRELADGGHSISVCISSPTQPASEVVSTLPAFEIKSGLEPKQLAREYNRSDLFLLPSLYEGFELSTIEALACGTPVMLNATGSRPTLEWLGCPALFRLEEARSPLSAIEAAVNRFRGARRAEIAAWAAERFDERMAGAQMEALLREFS